MAFADKNTRNAYKREYRRTHALSEHARELARARNKKYAESHRAAIAARRKTKHYKQFTRIRVERYRQSAKGRANSLARSKAYRARNLELCQLRERERNRCASCIVCGNLIFKRSVFCPKCFGMVRSLMGCHRGCHVSLEQMKAFVPLINNRQQLKRSYQCLKESRSQLREISKQFSQTGSVPLRRLESLFRNLTSKPPQPRRRGQLARSIA